MDTSSEGHAPVSKVHIVFYTDPLCCWCWAFDQHWQRFRAEYGHSIKWEYCLGGMIPDWDQFTDPLNMVERPAQMGPMWMEARHITGAPLDESIWMSDPPTSSYPASIAVKTAALQSEEAGNVLFHHLQEAVMTKKINIAKNENIQEVAYALSQDNKSVFDYERFVQEYNNEASREAFRANLRLARYNRIGRFPTLTMTRRGGTGIMLTGYRPYQVLLDAFTQIAPELTGASEGRALSGGA